LKKSVAANKKSVDGKIATEKSDTKELKKVTSSTLTK
jgi:hypothetical protein